MAYKLNPTLLRLAIEEAGCKAMKAEISRQVLVQVAIGDQVHWKSDTDLQIINDITEQREKITINGTPVEWTDECL